MLEANHDSSFGGTRSFRNRCRCRDEGELGEAMLIKREVLDAIKRGEITDGKTIIGLLMVAQNFSQYL